MHPTMPLRRLPRTVPSLLLSAFLTVQALTQALAQPMPTVRRPDPFDPQATVPALRYESATAPYRRLGDEKTLPWRDANDAVARIGGWRVYAREAQQADPPTSAPPASARPASAPPSSAPPAAKPPGQGGHLHHPPQHLSQP
ncbi:hypothetical protein [Sphaerotilus microaerophilus]|uniref:Uncharacterized protein n=1 Tax=Sphaerotilus microaerophilus TaxID=2914710 RepID=A0ABM7YLM7_9BURK|nr:hypothetical protein [Sphaerotilus sp. FB-5]BDI05350.1 hypothetical protein CATMQ487_23200 [Sphaerotilus sp. FB-5]